MNHQRALVPQLLDLIREHTGICGRMRTQIVRSARKVQAASSMIAEVDHDLRQIAQSHQELCASAQMMMRAVHDSGLMALPPVRQAAGHIEAMVDDNDSLIDDTRSASTLLQQMASQLMLIAGVLGEHSAAGGRAAQAAKPAPAANQRSAR
jgi:hypothetical protein